MRAEDDYKGPSTQEHLENESSQTEEELYAKLQREYRELDEKYTKLKALLGKVSTVLNTELITELSTALETGLKDDSKAKSIPSFFVSYPSELEDSSLSLASFIYDCFSESGKIFVVLILAAWLFHFLFFD
ncbi:unnamed protein product [Kuraishia capsulata CBS 1993]|uniref:Uncharacterized protein n=1 Tax=Kuraishia capsulata CBS 1993 TaxID=1382522 RepID=W6MSW5_9ASCO|nr:uncharacterized protein KUCA_T00005910001 [Kuraishia capsulata CBS 1993]CDK29916.1 unnamed protein product [Kuraishia capsulata CBS 1993]